MKKLYRIAMVAGVLVIALVAAGVAVLKSLDLNGYKGLIAEKTREATGRDLTIMGDLDLQISLSPSIAIDGVIFSNAPWGQSADMLRADTFAAEVALLPLLGGDVEVKRIILKGVDLVLETNSEGRGNWEFDTSDHSQDQARDRDDQNRDDRGDDDAASAVKLPVVNNVRMADVNVTYIDGVGGEQHSLQLENLDVKAAGIDEPLTIGMNAVYDAEPVSLAGTLGSIDALGNNDAFPVNLTAETAGITVVLDGIINNPREGRNFNLGFEVSSDDVARALSRIMTLAGQGAGDILPPNAIRITGAVRDQDGGYAIDGLAIKLGSSDLSGNLSIHLASAVPVLMAELSSTKFALSDVQKASDGKGSNGKSEEGAAAVEAAEAGNDGRVFPGEPIPLDGLRTVNAEISFSGESLVANNVGLSNIDAVLGLDSGNLRISRLDFDLGGGRVSGNLGLNGSGPTAKLAMNIAGKGIDYGQVLKEMADQEALTGTLDLDVDIEGAGKSVRALMAGLNGKFRVVSEKGRIDSGALTLLTGPLTSLLEGADFSVLRCAVVDFRITDGMATSKAMVLGTDGLSVVGAGTVDLKEEKLDLYFDPRAKNASVASLAEVGFIVSGTLKEPSVAPDAVDAVLGAASLAAGVATGGASLLLGSLLDTATSGVDNTDYCALALAGKPLEPAEPTDTGSSDGGAESGGNSASDAVDSLINNLFGN